MEPAPNKFVVAGFSGSDGFAAVEEAPKRFPNGAAWPDAGVDCPANAGLAEIPSALSLAGFSVVEGIFRSPNGLLEGVAMLGFGENILEAESPKMLRLWNPAGVVVEVFGLESGDICIESAGLKVEFAVFDWPKMPDPDVVFVFCGAPKEKAG